MRIETYQAIKAILDTDVTIPAPDRLAILQTCKSPIPKTPAKKEAPRLLKVRQVAEILHVHPKTVQRMVKRGLFQPVRLSSRAVRYLADEIIKVAGGDRISE